MLAKIQVWWLIYTGFCCLPLGVFAQTDTLTIPEKGFFVPKTKLHKPRFWALSSSTTLLYSGVMIGLDRAWYANYPRTRFHTFNDFGGWRGMDKAGHFFTTYFESAWVADLYKWAGIRSKKSAIIGAGAGMLFQTSLEMLDGFSGGWGFSGGDMLFNSLGAGLFLGQALAWDEQRFLVKMSTHKPEYSQLPISASNSSATTTIASRAANLFGTSIPEQFFKEYNGQTLWLSMNLAAWSRNKPAWLPVWLNVAFGYSIENVLGAERNSWQDKNGNIFAADAGLYPRQTQFFLSLDVDFSKIPTRRPWLRSLFKMLNIFKAPLPALEYNTLGKWKGHWFYF